MSETYSDCVFQPRHAENNFVGDRMNEIQHPNSFDVLICYNSENKSNAANIAEELRRLGLSPRLDGWDLQPGTSRQDAVEQLIAQARSAAVLIGKRKIVDWAREEYLSLLARSVSDGFPIIPVFLLDAPKKPEIPVFLANRVWVDFRENDPDPIDQLVWGITGKRRSRQGSQASHSARPSAKMGALHRVPVPPTNFIRRPKELGQLKQFLLREASEPPESARTVRVGLCGMAGVGKSTLAADLARDPSVRATFPDGVFWVFVGETQTIDGIREELADQLGYPKPGHGTSSTAHHFREALAGKSCLIILDDVWKVEHAEAFDGLDPKARVLLTTRERDLMTWVGAQHSMDCGKLDEGQAKQLLAEWSGESIDQISRQEAALHVLRECDKLPLAIAVCGGTKRGGAMWTEILTALKKDDLDVLYRELAGYVHRSLRHSFHVGLTFLRKEDEKHAERYLELGVFDQGADVPEAAIATLWRQTSELHLHQVGMLLARLSEKALLRVDVAASGRQVSLHNMQRIFIRFCHKDLPGLHAALLDGYRKESTAGWHRVPNDGYIFKWLAHHLTGAGRTDELRELLFDYRWLQAKLDATDVNAMIADYAFLPEEDQEARLVRDALQLSSHVLSENDGKSQLPAQLVGRLTGSPSPAIKRLFSGIDRWAKRPWLRPLNNCLASPQGALIQTFPDRVAEAYALALTPDGQGAAQ